MKEEQTSRVCEDPGARPKNGARTGSSEAEISSKERGTQVVFLPQIYSPGETQTSKNSPEQRIGDRRVEYFKTWCLWLGQIFSHQKSFGGIPEQLPGIHTAWCLPIPFHLPAFLYLSF